MRLNILRSLILGAVILTSAFAAMAQGNRILVSVPFDFHVGNKEYSAGTYRFDRLRNADFAAMTKISDDGEASKPGILPGMRIEALPYSELKSTDSKFYFNRYGDQYFLTKIVHPGVEKKYLFRTSKMEKELIATNRKPQMLELAVNLK